MENREPDRKAINKLSRYFNVSTDYLLGKETEKCEHIPCYGKVKTANFKYDINKESYPIYVSPDEYKKGSFVLEINDNDMQPLLMKKDLAIFLPKPTNKR